MLHFFRKIRRDLLANSQFFKYLKYAIGEIILVVLGILIALYINNQNEIRKEQEKFDEVLADVELELVYNISMSRYYLEQRLVVADSVYQKLLIDSLFSNDLIMRVTDFLINPIKWTVRGDAYKQLIQLNNLTEQQELIRNMLHWLNNDNRTFASETTNDIRDIKKENERIFKSHDWYGSWVLGNIDDKRIFDFFKNDPEFSKMILRDFQMKSYQRNQIGSYEVFAHDIYNIIYKYLDSIGTKHLDSLHFHYDSEDYKHYQGKYESKWCTDRNYNHDDSIAVTLEEDKLIYYGYRSDGPDTRLEIIPINKYHFRTNRGIGVYHLHFDDKGEVIGIRFSNSPSFILQMKKIP